MAELLDNFSETERKKCRKKSMPGWMDPMLARLTHDYFFDKGWIFERKLDGERALAYITPRGRVRLMSRN